MQIAGFIARQIDDFLGGAVVRPKGIAPFPAVERTAGAAEANERVVSVAAGEEVVARPAEEGVVAQSANEAVIASAAEQGRVLRDGWGEDDGIIPHPAVDA